MSERSSDANSKKKLQARVFPVHRLDQEVSGVLVFAKNPAAQKIWNEAFEKRRVQKSYEAWTSLRDFSHWPVGLNPERGPLAALGTEMTWTCKLLRGKRRAFESPQGAPSETRACRLSETAEKTVWRVQPITGRAHQIRFELSRHGFPILGDALYGSRQEFLPAAIALRAVRLEGPQLFASAPSEFIAKGLGA